MKLSAAEWAVLRAMTQGQFLKSHRDLEGHKAYYLHALDGSQTPVAWGVVETLTERGLIDSNKKFPAATYWLTEAGRKALGAAAEHTEQSAE